MILQLMSTFPPISETFIMREVRQLRTEGWDVRIGQLRPLHKTLPAQGFEDITPFVISAKWWSFDLLWGFLFFAVSRPLRMITCLRLISTCLHRPRIIARMLYILLAACRLGFRLRNSRLELIRASFLYTEALAARFIGALLEVPYSVTVYTVYSDYPKSIVEDLVKNAALLIADTEQARKHLLSLGATGIPIPVIYNSVDIRSFPDRQTTEPGTPIILGVGRLDPKKGFDVLISACSILKERGFVFQCALVGDGPERETLLGLRQSLGLDDVVHFDGKQNFEEILSWYYKATVFVMPSVVTPKGETDGLPTVVVEAMASCLPVVGTTVGGIPEAVQDGVNGFLVPPNAPDMLADRLQLLLSDATLREQFGRAGRKIAEARFDLRNKGRLLSRPIRERIGSQALELVGTD